MSGAPSGAWSPCRWTRRRRASSSHIPHRIRAPLSSSFRSNPSHPGAAKSPQNRLKSNLPLRRRRRDSAPEKAGIPRGAPERRRLCYSRATNRAPLQSASEMGADREREGEGNSKAPALMAGRDRSGGSKMPRTTANHSASLPCPNPTTPHLATKSNPTRPGAAARAGRQGGAPPSRASERIHRRGAESPRFAGAERRREREEGEEEEEGGSFGMERSRGLHGVPRFSSFGMEFLGIQSRNGAGRQPTNAFVQLPCRCYPPSLSLLFGDERKRPFFIYLPSALSLSCSMENC